MADTSKVEASKDTQAVEIQGASSNNAYGDSNTKDYSQSITDQYTQFVKDHNTSTDDTVETGTSRLNQIQEAGERATEASAQQAQRDSNELRQTRKAMEKNEGNRQRIGESQYGVAENAYDQQMSVINGVRDKLRTDVARQVADLRARGDYESANAALETAQAQFRQLYEEGLRIGGNLRSNYEYQTGLQREDAEIQREQDNADTDWKRTMGEFMLKHGVTPSDDILGALGIDSSAANLYIKAVSGGSSGGYSSGGGSSGSSSGGSSKKSGDTGTLDLDLNTGGSADATTKSDGGYSTLPFGQYSNYNSSMANTAMNMAKNGDLNGAWSYLTSNAAFFSEANYGSLLEITKGQAARSTKTAANSTKTSTDSTKKTAGGSGKIATKVVAATK